LGLPHRLTSYLNHISCYLVTCLCKSMFALKCLILGCLVCRPAPPKAVHRLRSCSLCAPRRPRLATSALSLGAARTRSRRQAHRVHTTRAAHLQHQHAPTTASLLPKSQLTTNPCLRGNARHRPLQNRSRSSTLSWISLAKTPTIRPTARRIAPRYHQASRPVPGPCPARQSTWIMTCMIRFLCTGGRVCHMRYRRSDVWRRLARRACERSSRRGAGVWARISVTCRPLHSSMR
jgi:hypothetical protein